MFQIINVYLQKQEFVMMAVREADISELKSKAKTVVQSIFQSTVDLPREINVRCLSKNNASVWFRGVV